MGNRLLVTVTVTVLEMPPFENVFYQPFPGGAHKTIERNLLNADLLSLQRCNHGSVNQMVKL